MNHQRSHRYYFSCSDAKGCTIENAFLQTLAVRERSIIDNVSFRNDTEKAREMVDNGGKQETKNFTQQRKTIEQKDNRIEENI